MHAKSRNTLGGFADNARPGLNEASPSRAGVQPARLDWVKAAGLILALSVGLWILIYEAVRLVLG